MNYYLYYKKAPKNPTVDWLKRDKYILWSKPVNYLSGPIKIEAIPINTEAIKII